MSTITLLRCVLVIKNIVQAEEKRHVPVECHLRGLGSRCLTGHVNGTLISIVGKRPKYS